MQIISTGYFWPFHHAHPIQGMRLVFCVGDLDPYVEIMR